MNKMNQILAATILALLVCTGTSFAEEKGPAELVLKSTIDPATKPKPAYFPHAVHQEMFDCGICHHTQGEDGKLSAYLEGMQIYKCESCHNKGQEAIGQNLNTFKKAAHERCKKCHQERKNEGKTAGPTKCSGCHKKDLK